MEFRVDGVPAADNRFDPDQIRLDATVTAPSGRRVTVPGFWYQDFTRALADGAEVLTPAGAPEWRIRFTPTEPGDHALSLQIATGVAAGAPGITHFTVPAEAAAGQRGWVRVGPDGRYFETSDGRPLRLIGANVCWADARGSYDYDRWFPAMRQAGENFARLWMSPWWAGIEHRAGTLNRYDLRAAWQLDYVFDSAERDGIYLLLCLDHHGMYQTANRNWGGTNNFWKGNPYSALAGGPCGEPNDFFTHPAARALYLKRLRYLVARYGSSPNLLAWQLFNEIDNVFGPLKDADVIAWHRTMAQWLKANDPWHHLVTTSLTGGSERPEIWAVPELDFTSYHSYFEAAPARRIPDLARSFVEKYRRPFILGEFGVNARGWNLAEDPYLRGFRQALWGGALGGSVGTAMPWWWQDMHADNVYPLYAAMTGILRTAGWNEGAWSPVDLDRPDPAPAGLGEVVPAGEAFAALLRLNGSWRTKVSGECTVADPLSADRSAEFLCSYLQGDRHPELQHRIRLTAWFGAKARLVMHVNAVGADAELIVRVDGAEMLRTKLADRDGLAIPNHEIDQDFAVEIPAGKRTIELSNAGDDWIYFDFLRLEQVRTAESAGGWRSAPEAVGLHRGARAILYVCSPAVVFPAGAHRYNPEPVTGASVTLKDWPAGRFSARWLDPRTGAAVATTAGETRGGALILPLPPLADDLAGIVDPVAVDAR
jgi:hypothetical protein